MGLLAASAVVLGLLAFRQVLLGGRPEAVVLVDEAYGYVAPDEGEEAAFKATEGTLVRVCRMPEMNEAGGRADLSLGAVEDARPGPWIEVSLADGTRGWMQGRQMELVAV